MQGFVPSRYYVHEKFTDVAIQVSKAFYVKENKTWKLKVNWCRWYKFNNKLDFFGISQRIEVKDLTGWRRLNVEFGIPFCKVITECNKM